MSQPASVACGPVARLPQTAPTVRSSSTRWAPAALLLLCAIASALDAQPVNRGVVVTPATSEPQRPELVLDLQGFVGQVDGLCFSPDGTLLAAAGNKEVRIWNLERGQLIATLRGQRGRNLYGNCYAVAFSPDGRQLVVGIDDYSQNGSLRVYDTSDWSRIQEVLPGHDVPVRRLAFARDGQQLAAAGENGRIFLWDWPARHIRSVVPPRDPSRPLYTYFEFPTAEPLLFVNEAAGASVVSVPRGERLPSDSPLPDAMRRWLTLVRQFHFPAGASPAAMSLRLERDRWLAAGMCQRDGADAYWVAFCRTDRPDPLQVYWQHRYVVTAVALSPSGDLAASADVLGEIHVWQTSTGHAVQVLRPLGQPVYWVSFDAASQRIGYGTTPLSGGQWKHNHYGSLERNFELATRRITSDTGLRYPEPVAVEAGYSLEPVVEKGRNALRCLQKGSLLSQYPVRAAASPTAFTFLRPSTLGLELPCVFGDDSGGLLLYNGLTTDERREFVGHGAFVTSVCPSGDGRFLVTCSTDHKICLWSLENYRPTGDVDFRYLSDTVTEVKPGGSAAQAGIRAGDRFVALDGQGITEIANRRLEGTYDLRPGQRVRATLERDGKPYQAELVLQPGADLAEPLVSLLVVNEHDWILWTPQGYYDASPGGDHLIGWHINQGPGRSAKFYTAHQFRKQLYHPELIDLVLQTGSVDEALRRAGQQRPDAGTSSDLRQPQVLEKLEPPRVRIVAPPDGSRTQEAQVFVVAEIQSQNELPLAEVNVLVNGRPALARGVLLEPTQTKLRSSFSRQVSLVPGQNAITVIASNAASSSQPATVNISYEPARQPTVARPDLYLLAIGISEYAHPQYNLRFAHEDARAFVDAWKGQEGIVYRQIQTKLLVNQEASVANILAAMDWLVKSVTQRDVGVVFISAHGLRDPRQNYYLASHQIDPTNLRSTGLRFSEIKELLRDLPCKVLLFVDTCHSGGVTGAKAAAWEDPLHDLVSEECGAVVFSSSLPREVSLEDPSWKHGAFTKAILDTLVAPEADTDRDGYLSLTELEDQVYRRVKSLTEGRQHAVVERPPTIRNFNFYHLPSR